MHPRRSHRFSLRRVAFSAALATTLLVPATAAEAKKAVKKPVVTSVRPAQARVGDTIVVYGRNFVRGKAKNTVVFKREGARAVFVRADVATLRQIRVVLPERLTDFLAVKDGDLTFTRFQIRVLSRRLGKTFTSVSKSPMIGPKLPPAPPGVPAEAPPAAAADGDCDGDGVKNSVDADDDDDLLSDGLEGDLKTDGCKRDTDGDGVEDGYEYRSAKDLNDDRGDGVTPYPTKMPYPNPLFADASTDYDGDGLHLVDEYKLWNGYGGRNLDQLNYSDGKQYSVNVAALAYDKQQAFLAAAGAKGISQASLLDMDGFDVEGDEDNPFTVEPDTTWSGNPGITDVERYYFDFDKNGLLSDDERDEDADGLPNWTEAHGFMTPGWWKGIYAKEKPFTTQYGGTAIADADSDGDGLLDGADDQDHDGFANVRELSRRLAAGEVADGTPWVLGDAQRPNYIRYFDSPEDGPYSSRPLRGWVNPFNPCLPNPDSRTCPRYVPADNVYPPFDPKGDVYLVLN